MKAILSKTMVKLEISHQLTKLFKVEFAVENSYWSPPMKIYNQKIKLQQVKVTIPNESIIFYRDFPLRWCLPTYSGMFGYRCGQNSARTTEFIKYELVK